MSSNVSMSPAKHSKPPIQKEAKNEKNCTNGHSEDVSSEKSLPIKVTDKADASSDSAKDKQKTSKANKTTKKEDTKINHKSEKNDMTERQIPAASSKEKELVKSEIASETTTQNEIANDTPKSKVDQMKSSEQANGEELPETKTCEENNTDKNATEISTAKSTEITENIKDTPNEDDSVVTTASDSNLNQTADEEMPSFTLDDDDEKKVKVKILRLKSSPLLQKSKASDKSKRKKKAKEVAKEVEMEIQEPAKAAIEPIRQRPSYTHISGRRSFRNLPDLPPRRYHYETHKQIKDDLDITSSSLNVTVGSEVATDNSFSFFGFGKKREYAESVDTQSSKSEIETTAKTPKRAKLDRSGIFSIISTPISLLRSQFSKASMHCSTPNNEDQKTDEDGVENVSVVDTEEILTHKPLTEDNPEVLNKDIRDDKCLDDMAEDAFEVQTQIVESQADVKRRGCNVM